MSKSGKQFKPWLDEVRGIVDGNFTNGVGADGEERLTLLAERLPFEVALAWIGTFERFSLGELPKKPGVYVADVHTLQYVGLASNVFSRWWSESSFVPGHLSEHSACRSRAVVDVMRRRLGGLVQATLLVRVHGSKNYARLAVEECFTFVALLRISAQSHVPWWDRRLVNMPANLGAAKRADAVPVVAVHVESGEYALFESTWEASRGTGVDAGGVGMVVRGVASSSNGFAFRRASDAEIEFLAERRCVLGFSPAGDSLTVVRPTLMGKFAVEWSGGPLSVEGLERLRLSRQVTDSPQSEFLGVRWENWRMLWKAFAYSVESGRKRMRSVGYFDDDRDAYEATLAWVAEDPDNRVLAVRKNTPRSERVLNGYWRPGQRESARASLEAA